jgi:hypothetical protein
MGSSADDHRRECNSCCGMHVYAAPLLKLSQQHRQHKQKAFKEPSCSATINHAVQVPKWPEEAVLSMQQNQTQKADHQPNWRAMMCQDVSICGRFKW